MKTITEDLRLDRCLTLCQSHENGFQLELDVTGREVGYSNRVRVYGSVPVSQAQLERLSQQIDSLLARTVSKRPLVQSTFIPDFG